MMSGILDTEKTALGIELGSTRIKAVLTGQKGEVLATGFYDWENHLIDGVWTYALEEIHAGLKACYASLREDVRRQHGVTLNRVGAIGISAMMHGYMAFDAEGRQLAPFQTWRNTNTQQAADELTELFRFNIPQRWSIAHLYQRILDKEVHVASIASISVLSSYVHRLLTGRHVVGIGDASGMFPIDSGKKSYNEDMLNAFDSLVADRGYPWRHVGELLPEVLCAGETAGYLTKEGAAFLDESGTLQAGIPFCPPEGDAGTGMVATNAVGARTGNVSAGTSTFAMLVLDAPLKQLHREIDLVTTPAGQPVAMSHANNGTTDLNAWIGLFCEFSGLSGHPADSSELYRMLYRHSLSGDADCGGLLPFGYYSGENVTGINEGRPLLVRTPLSRFNLANLMRAHLYSSLAAVKMGLDILMSEEDVKVDRMTGHGGLFRTKGVAQRYLSAAVNAPVTVMETADAGGAWGVSILAAFLLWGKAYSLEDYLEKEIFAGVKGETLSATQEESDGFAVFMERYKSALSVEEEAVRAVQW